jgi:nitronate monooxygenase
MGVAVSNWKLARAVSLVSQLGVVSGTGLTVVLTRRLQLGDPGGHIRRAAAAFPYQHIARKWVEHYFVEGGKPLDKPFKSTPTPEYPLSPAFAELTVLANFVEVFLAKEGHHGVVGINYLEKIQLPMPAQIFGAMLAGVDYILIGAGIPIHVPGAIDALADGRPGELKLAVDGAQPGEEWINRFDPAAFCGGAAPKLKRPKFFAIVSSATLAMTLARKSNGSVDGFIVESSIAGGHNAPPRGPLQLTADGEPVYGTRDEAELDKIRALGKPFYLAGGCASHAKLVDALALGASGIQVGTAFAFCDESGIDPELKHRVISMNREEKVRVFTDPTASPTSFPFKVVQMDGTISDVKVYDERTRICDLGYLRKAYRKDDGTLGHRCAAEPVDQYVRKGGLALETIGKKCICNALFATIGLPQQHNNGEVEPPLLTAGSSAIDLMSFMRQDRTSYSAHDVVNVLLKDDA